MPLFASKPPVLFAPIASVLPASLWIVPPGPPMPPVRVSRPPVLRTMPALRMRGVTLPKPNSSPLAVLVSDGALKVPPPSCNKRLFVNAPTAVKLRLLSSRNAPWLLVSVLTRANAEVAPSNVTSP